jgi:16S rRNA (guanine966-N2)-methyltransferase
VAATFVDRDAAAAAAIRDNLRRTRLGPGEVVTADALRFLERRIPDEDRFDLVFVDPPYDVGASEIERVLEGVASALPARGWTVALTRGNRTSTHVIPVDWAVARRLRYGDSLVFLYREV